jgi:acetyl-CoA synthetase
MNFMILPKPEIVNEAYVKDYESVYKESIANPEAFWEKIAKELEWYKPWNKVLQWNYPYARWFVGGQCNIVHNALDRHLKTVNDTTLVRPHASGIAVKDKLALIWEGQNGEVRTFTYQQLNDEVCRFANALKSLGLKKGDHVTIYLPRIPEQAIAMLACAKIGLVHSVVFSGFSVEALKNRILDAESKVIICANAYPYKDKIVDCKKNVDEAVKDCPMVKKVIVVRRLEDRNMKMGMEAGQEVRSGKLDEKNLSPTLQPPNLHPNLTSNFQSIMLPDRDLWWHDLVAKQDTLCSTEIMEATDPLYILYTSGSTGKPKGVVHGHGGYMVGTYITLKWVFNLQPDDIYWCTADCGWVTGHSYIVYSPLINGVTTFIYEGGPDYPDPGKWWSLIEKYKVTKFYTAPTAVRSLMRYGDDWPKKYDLSSLKILGTVGEPINPEAWLWYFRNIGREICPIMDTWWQTETGMFMITPLPTVSLKPGSCFKPFPGIEADVVDEKGNSLHPSSIGDGNEARIGKRQTSDDTNLVTDQQKTYKQGYLVIKTPWPAMLLDVYNNPQKYRETYFENEAIKSEARNPKPETSTNSPNPNNRNSLKNSNLSNLKIASSFDIRISNFIYFTGDSAKIDEDGYFWIIGRNDDVIKVSGHRLGSAELESAFVAHPSVAEAAVIGKPHEIKGESIKAFVILKQGVQPSDQLKQELTQQVRKSIGPIATPDEIEFVDKLPKTRSGKIMRRVLKAKELGQPLGDTSTLET